MPRSLLGPNADPGDGVNMRHLTSIYVLNKIAIDDFQMPVK